MLRRDPRSLPMQLTALSTISSEMFPVRARPDAPSGANILSQTGQSPWQRPGGSRTAPRYQWLLLDAREPQHRSSASLPERALRHGLRSIRSYPIWHRRARLREPCTKFRTSPHFPLWLPVPAVGQPVSGAIPPHIDRRKRDSVPNEVREGANVGGIQRDTSLCTN